MTFLTGNPFTSYDGSSTGIQLLGEYFASSGGETPWFITTPYHQENQGVVITGNTFVSTSSAYADGANFFLISSSNSVDGGVKNLSTHDLTITDNSFYCAPEFSVWVWAVNLIVSGNTFRDSNCSGEPGVSQIDVGAQHGVVTDNIFEDDLSQTNLDMYVDQDPWQQFLAVQRYTS